jgi:hypothetical protein
MSLWSIATLTFDTHTLARVGWSIVYRNLIGKLRVTTREWVLARPRMLTALAVHRIGRLVLGQLPFADRARFGHQVCHDLGPQWGLCTLCTKMFDAGAYPKTAPCPRKSSE